MSVNDQIHIGVQIKNPILSDYALPYKTYWKRAWLFMLVVVMFFPLKTN